MLWASECEVLCISWSKAIEQAAGSKQDVAEETEDMLCCEKNIRVILWVPSSPGSASMCTHVSDVL